MDRRTPRTLALVLTLVASVTVAQGAIPLQDDAGSGQDAPDDPTEAYELPGPGLYEANLSTPDDADWFTLPGSQGQTACLQAEVDGIVAADAVLSDGDALDRAVERTLLPPQSIDLGLASQDPTPLVLGLTPADAASLGTYRFNVSAAPISEADVTGDPGPTDDAPGSGDLVRVPDACFRGVLGPTDVDAYNFTGEAGENVTLSLAVTTSENPETTLTYLNLTSPDGREVLNLTDGDLASTTLDRSGNWTLSVESPSQAELTYGIGTVRDPDDSDDDDEESSSCRPGCATLLP